MSLQRQITRITGLRNRIRAKLISLGVLNNTDADLASCTDALESITGTSTLLRYGLALGVYCDIPEQGGFVLKFLLKCSSIDYLKTSFVHLANSILATPNNIVLTMFMTSIAPSSISFHGRLMGGSAFSESLSYVLVPDSSGEYALYIRVAGLPMPSLGERYYIHYTYTDGPLNTSGINTWTD